MEVCKSGIECESRVCSCGESFCFSPDCYNADVCPACAEAIVETVWTDEFIGEKPNFSIKFYDVFTEAIIDVREIHAENYGMAVAWASLNCPPTSGCLIVNL